jgi:hypothetical protein
VLAADVVGAVHRPLQLAEERLGQVGRHAIAHVLAALVVDPHMAARRRRDRHVGQVTVGVQHRGGQPGKGGIARRLPGRTSSVSARWVRRTMAARCWVAARRSARAASGLPARASCCTRTRAAPGSSKLGQGVGSGSGELG